MSRIVVVAEKPSVGRDIARVLGCKSKADGYLYSDEYAVSWAIGHLITLCEPEDYDPRYKSWSKAGLPIVPDEIKLKAIAKTGKQLTVLRKLMNAKDTSEVICATDSGREGELIFRYIYTFIKCRKPVKRLWISSMTDAAIRDGFNKLKPGADYDNLYESAKCRSEADWLVGINATRAYTVKYNTLLSVGRVQTPTLAILAERQREIAAFVPRDYWELKARIRATGEYGGTWIDAETGETKLYDRERAEAIKREVDGKPGVVQSIENEEKRQQPWQLYDLTELQRDCNRRYGYSAQKTLTLAQALYEKHKMITYPRTDSRYISEDIVPKVRGLLRKLEATDYGMYASYVLGLEKLPVTKRVVDNAKVSDHHAIIPTERVNLSVLGADERKVCELVVKRFIAVFYPPYVYNITRIITRVSGEDFLTKGTTVISPGFMELYKNDSREEKADDDELPAVTEGEAVMLTECELQQKRTQPPKPYTEATLLSAMENAGRFVDDETLREQLKGSGLGTPATRAGIIERLLQVGYAERRGKALIPTDKGMKLIAAVPPELRSPETTGKWEKGLTSIANGGLSSRRFMESITRYVGYIIEQSGKPTEIVFNKEKR